MRWSALKSRFESLLAEKLKGRLQIHVTEYTLAGIYIGRGWLSLDGKEFVSVQIPSIYDAEMRFDVNDMNFGHAIGEYLNMSFEHIKASKDPIIQGLSFLDKRFGKRLLKHVEMTGLHDFGLVVYQERCKLEGIETENLIKPVDKF